jgi:isopropylmalate/homocitrate/citramalate synthase
VSVRICDVGPRDGLQNHAITLAPAERAELAAMLARTGVARVEAASFVHPGRVPQMAGAEDVVAALPETGAEYSGLVLNERGYERAQASGLRRVNYTVAVTDAFCRRNQGCDLAEAVAGAERIAERARHDGVRMTVTLAVAFGCPFEGDVAASSVVAVAERVALPGVDELVVADTIGVGVPAQVAELVGLLRDLPVTLGGHFHDTRSTGIANALAAVELGVELLDASIGGTGGCPFAPGASGNIATEDLVYALERTGIATGVSLPDVVACTAWLAERLGEPLSGAHLRDQESAVARV